MSRSVSSYLVVRFLSFVGVPLLFVVCIFYAVISQTESAKHRSRFDTSRLTRGHALALRMNSLAASVARLAENNAVKVNLMLGIFSKVASTLEAETRSEDGARYFIISLAGEKTFIPALPEMTAGMKAELLRAATSRKDHVLMNSRAGGGIYSLFSVPILKKDGKMLGLACVRFNLAGDETYWQHFDTVAPEGLWIQNEAEMVDLKTGAARPIVGKASSHGPDFEVMFPRTWVEPVQGFDRLFYVFSTRDLISDKNFWLFLMLGIFVAVFIFSFRFAFITAENMTRPVAGIAAQADEIAADPAGKLLSKADLSYVELEQMVQAFNHLLAELAQREESLARAKKMEAIGLLAGGVAHDLNNILAGLVGFPEVLLLEENLPRETREGLDFIRQTGGRAALLISDLLTIARGVSCQTQPMNLNQAVKDYWESSEFKDLSAFHDQIEFESRLEPSLLNIKASAVHIQKVVANLASNAAEAFPGDLGRIVVSTANRYLDYPLKGYESIVTGEYACLTVSDNGPGIPADHCERIFEPFYSTKKMGRSGTGLGLAVVWNTVQDLGGYIDLTTGEQGTAFEIYFPVCRERLPDEEEPVAVEALKGRGQAILVVDDEPEQLKVAGALLSYLDYRVETARSGESGLEMIRTFKPDLVVLDMIMEPGMGGQETYARMSALRPGQKAILASGFVQTDKIDQAQSQGAGPFVKKPYTIQTLGQAVKETLAG